MKTVITGALAHWKSHNAPRMGAALSYYATLSFVPLLILLIAVSSTLFSKDIIELTVMRELTSAIGSSASLYISELLHNNELRDIGFIAALVSSLTLIVGALGVFSELDSDMDELWEMPVKKPAKQLSFLKKALRFLHQKLVALSVLPVLAFLLAISIGLTFLLSAVQANANVLKPFDVFIPLAQIIIPFVLSTLLFMVMYRILPNRKLPWKVLAIGAFVTAALFIIGNVLIALYIQFMLNTSIFGGASSLVGLLVWMYYSSQVFFLGASFTFVYAKEKGLVNSRD